MRIVLAVVLAVGVCAIGSAARAEEGAAPAAAAVSVPAPVKEVVRPAEEMVYKEMMPGVERAIMWGDPAVSGYGSLTRFAAGVKSPMHYHSSVIKLVVISGVFAYGTESSQNKLAAGSYIIIPAGRRHTSGTTAESGCVIFEESDGKFDMVPPMPVPAATPAEKKKK